MKKLVIFDLDGTLLNTIADLANSTNYALKVLGYPIHEPDKYKFHVGNASTSFLSVRSPTERKQKRMYSVSAKSLCLITTSIMRIKAARIPELRNYWKHCRQPVCNWQLPLINIRQLRKN